MLQELGARIKKSWTQQSICHDPGLQAAKQSEPPLQPTLSCTQSTITACKAAEDRAQRSKAHLLCTRSSVPSPTHIQTKSLFNNENDLLLTYSL